VDAYDLILRRKAQLLSFDEPVRFIFAHSALREGWDNPSQIEASLNGMHDSILQQGGVLYARFLSGKYINDPVRHHLQQALMVGSGSIVVYTREHKEQKDPDAEEARLLNLKAIHPGLFPTATRTRLETNSDDKYYAVLKTARDHSERMVAVYNFQPTSQTVQLYLGVIDTHGMVDAESGVLIANAGEFAPTSIEVPGYGYRFFTVLPRELQPDSTRKRAFE